MRRSTVASARRAAITAITALTTLAAGATLATGVASAEPEAQSTGRIAGRIWFDRNTNQQQDTGEPGLRKDDVVLLLKDGQPAGRFSTDAQGAYRIDGVAPGRYRLTNTDHGSYANTTPISLDVDVVADTTSNAHFGILGGIVFGTTWRDLNADGARQPDDPAQPGNPPVGLGGLTRLTGPAFFAVTTNDENGNYRFDDIPFGSNYQVQTPDWRHTEGLSWTKPGIDSDVDFVRGWSAPLAIGPETLKHQIDAGYFRPKGDTAIGNLRSDPDRKNYRIGETFTMTLAVANNGDAPDTLGFRVSWPEGLSRVTVGGMNCFQFQPTSMECWLHNTSLPGESTDVTITMRADAQTVGEDILFRTFTGPFGDVDPSNDKVERKVVVTPAR